MLILCIIISISDPPISGMQFRNILENASRINFGGAATEPVKKHDEVNPIVNHP